MRHAYLLIMLALAGCADSEQKDDAEAPDASSDVAAEASACTSGKTACADTDGGALCVDTTSDPSSCGKCWNACTTASGVGYTPGPGNPDPQIYPNGYDGGPGWSLGTAACTQGACGVTCPSSMTLCSDGVCWDTQNSHDNCGACGTSCKTASEWCDQGHCCPPGSAWCTSKCVDILNDPTNCGTCGNACGGSIKCAAGACGVTCGGLVGPKLTGYVTGWPYAGIRIKVLKNTTLTSFVVNNHGANDLVTLETTTGTVLHSLQLPGSALAFTANVDWPLVAGTTYDLMLNSSSNGAWTSFFTWPQTATNGSFEVDGTVWNSGKSHDLQTAYYFTFTNLKSCP